MPGYRYSVSQSALETFAECDPAEQARLQRAFETVSHDPEGHAEIVRIEQGREIHGRWFGNWLVIYYLDHPIRTVVITDCIWS